MEGEEAVLGLFAAEEALGEGLDDLPLGDGPAPVWRYPPALRRALDHFRYLLGAGEYSARGVQLCALLLRHVGNHYAAWDYRSEFLLRQSSPALLAAELAFCDAFIRADVKGFQSWNHRRAVYEQLGAVDYARERAFLAEILAADARNYHLWSFRTWLADRFALWAAELECVEPLLRADALNNSLWSFRHFLAGRLRLPLAAEEALCWASIRALPDNESSWSYLFGLYPDGLSPAARADIAAFAESDAPGFFALRALLMDELRRPPAARDKPRCRELLGRLEQRAPHRRHLWAYLAAQMEGDAAL